MRFFQTFIIGLIFFVVGAALAEDSTGPAPPPPIDEYNNVPPGLLMTGAMPEIDTTAAAAATEDEVMTMDDLVAAYNKGQYDLVAKHVIPIADGNYPQAQELLGIMYHNGQGVPKDLNSAVEWLTKAAEAGRPLAEHHLAIMAFAGDGMQQDTVKALMWLDIAILHYQDGPEKTRAIEDRNNITVQISRRDKQRARDMAHDWLEKRGEGALVGLSDEK